MNLLYSKRGACQTLDEYCREKTGKGLKAINRFKPYYLIPNLERVLKRIRKAILDGQLIYVFGDYDTDGISCVSGLALLLNAMGCKNFKINCPRRFSDGYGINVNTVNAIPPGALLITVDNGIKAFEALTAAAERNIEVIILDHHMADHDDKNGEIILPPASIIVDPEAIPDGCDWDGYCGAGLVCELAKLALPPSHMVLQQIIAIAAIGTVADVVPLLSANRKIVKEGLDNIKAGIMPMGLMTIVDQITKTSKITDIKSDTLGYYISPTFNAAGRLHDTGAMAVVVTILENNPQKAANYAAQLIGWNTERKDITNGALKNIQIEANDSINFVSGNIHPGCLGLVAGKLVEATGRPSFVVAPTSDGMHFVGSARSNSPENNVEHMLSSASSLLTKYGGHAEAAGFSFKKENYEALHEALSSIPLVPIECLYQYDLDLEIPELPATITDLENAEPFGKCFERPVYRMRIDNFTACPTSDGEHIRFVLPGNITCIAFHQADKYEKMFSPKSMYVYGYPQWNYYRGQKSPQFMVNDFEPAV